MRICIAAKQKVRRAYIAVCDILMFSKKFSTEIILAIVFCSGLCLLENRSAAMLLVAFLACLVFYMLLSGRVSFSIVLIPMITLPVSYFLASIANNGLTFYSIGQTMLMCIPLLASLCIQNAKGVLSVIAIGTCFLGIASLLGMVIPIIPNTFTLPGFHSDSRLRLQTLLGYANTGGILFGCGIFAMLRLLHKTKYLFIAFLAFCLLLTGSRFAIIQTAVLLAAYYALKFKAKRSAIIISIVFFSGLVLCMLFKPEIIMNSSLALRFVYWSDALKVFFNNAIFGIGAEGYNFKIFEIQSAAYEVKYVHSAFLQAAVDAGIIALVSLCIIFILSLVRAWRNSKEIFFIVLLLLFHSTVDITLSFFPALMLLGMCSVDPAEINIKTTMKPMIIVILLSITISSSYLSVGEYFYTKGIKAERKNELEAAEKAYQSSLSFMPGDFRSSAKLAWIYILEHKQEEAIYFLEGTDCERFNKTVRSELLITAYKNIGLYSKWNTETLSLLEYAPLKRTAYTERAEYLVCAYNSLLISEDEYESEYNALLTRLNNSNKSINGYFTEYLLEKNRILTL